MNSNATNPLTQCNRCTPAGSEKARVSVIVPTYNRAHILPEALDSVWSQTYRPIELIIVDDGSTDHTDERAREWCVKHQGNPTPAEFIAKYVRSEVNKGPGAAREIGRLIANGDYICYLDSDDFWHPDKTKKQVDTLIQNPIAGMCYCSAKEFSTLPLDDSERLRRRSDEAFETFLPTLLLSDRRPWGTSACMWTRKATDQIGPWFPGRVREDFEYEARAGCHDIRISFLPEVLCYYRIRRSDGPESEGLIENRVQEIPATISMAQNLDRFGRLAERLTYVRLVTHLYRRALWLIIHGRGNSGKEYLSQILHLSSTTRRMKLWIGAVYYLGHILHTSLVARLALKIDPSLLV